MVAVRVVVEPETQRPDAGREARGAEAALPFQRAHHRGPGEVIQPFGADIDVAVAGQAHVVAAIQQWLSAQPAEADEAATSSRDRQLKLAL